jgi:peptide-methionine (S)-S-oxide reductase
MTHRSVPSYLGILLAVLAAGLPAGCGKREEPPAMSHAQGSDATHSPVPGGPQPARTEKATFAAGCFWGVEAAFRRVPGVVATAVGYTGGTTKDPTYREVCTGRTAHAEAVQVVYDPDAISYAKLLETFWGCHDPTTRNRQGPDVGTQYRSGIFFHDEEQAAAARASRDALRRAGKFGGREVVTEIAPASQFYRAEEYHQRYLEKQGRAACSSGGH